ncbi:MAG: T9SS type A sorting domain-containing protein [Bacteroidota bacterium]
MKYLFSLLLLVPLAGPTFGQQVGDCQLGSSTVDLDANNVRAALYNNGGFFWRGAGNVYTVPKDGQANAIFNAEFWIGGLAPDGAAQFSGTLYGPWEFWPGPLSANGNPPDDCDDYDRLYSVYDSDIRAYEHDGTLTDDLRDWPHHLGAPVVDGDGIAGNYDLAAGDRPHVYGDQSVWWVMNDAGNTKDWSQTAPIGVEVQVQAFSASCLPSYRANEAAVARVNDALTHATYYHFTIIHKGQEPLREAYIGWWTDGDLGNAADDFVGSDSTIQMMYYYNGEDFDEGLDGYGDQPPAMGHLLAKGVQNSRTPDRQPVGFTNVMQWDLGFTFSQNIPENYYRYMQSLWNEAYNVGSRRQHVTLGGNGLGGTIPVDYHFPGDPVMESFWSEENTDGAGSRNTPADRNILAGSGPFDVMPGDTLTFTLAIPWARSVNRLASIVKLRQSAGIVRGATEALMQYDIQSCPAAGTSEPEVEQPDPDALGYYLLRQNYPEPFNQQTTIRYEVIDTVPVTLTVYDLLGRRVRTLVDGMQSAGVYDVVFEAGDLPTGLYFYRLEAAGYVSITRRMTLQR